MAHYDCTCCGESFGISHENCPECQKGRCARSQEVPQNVAHPGVSAPTEPVAFQQEVDRWMDACFGQTIKADKLERCDRFIEESLEFAQAVGYSADRAHALVDYVFGRDVGEVKQEVGGVMVTLAAACNTVGIDIQDAAQTELARVWTKVEAIRAKQAAKPTGSALPIPTPPAGA